MEGIGTTYLVIKEQNLQPRKLYLAKLLPTGNGDYKSLTDKKEVKEFTTTKPALQELLKEFL